MPYVSDCRFRSQSNDDFDFMRLYARGTVVRRALLHFKSGRTHDDVLARLEKALGAPTSRARTTEERFVHNLVEWRASGFRVVYDFGGIDEPQPVYLIHDRLPLPAGGFNPPMVDLSALDGSR